jgi:hypothetical protein
MLSLHVAPICLSAPAAVIARPRLRARLMLPARGGRAPGRNRSPTVQSLRSATDAPRGLQCAPPGRSRSRSRSATDVDILERD